MSKLQLITAVWCGTCRPVKEYIKEKGLDVELLDVDRDYDRVGTLGVRGVPTLIDSSGNMVTTVAAIMNVLKEHHASSSNS